MVDMRTVSYEAVRSDFCKVIHQAYADVKDGTETQEDADEVWHDYFFSILVAATKGTVFADVLVAHLLEVEANTLAVAESELPDDPDVKRLREGFNSDMTRIMDCLYGNSFTASN
jgi:hypothetical protein